MHTTSKYQQQTTANSYHQSGNPNMAIWQSRQSGQIHNPGQDLAGRSTDQQIFFFEKKKRPLKLENN